MAFGSENAGVFIAMSSEANASVVSVRLSMIEPPLYAFSSAATVNPLYRVRFLLLRRSIFCVSPARPYR
jgi:hypothetical protein